MNVRKIITGGVACVVVCGAVPCNVTRLIETPLTASAIHSVYEELEYVKYETYIKIMSCSMYAVSVEIPREIDEVEVKIIEDFAFYGCEDLESVAIPESVRYIGISAFKDCFSLKDVYYSGTEEDWEKITIFEDNDDLKNATIHYNYKSEDDGTEVLFGDANCDGAVNIADATAIIQFIANPDRYPFDGKALKNADCCNPGDGVTPLDAYAIQLLEAGSIDSLPYKK